tara:strand:+ start:13405 stop:14802 length:1398 start_codon:yes stop_codon:yes gene_type:complete
MSTHNLLLKILSGPHQGAEIALNEGDIIIGSNPDCDIILSDVTVAEQQLKLAVSAEGQISISPLSENTFLDGQAIEEQEEPLAIEAFQYITLGTTHLVIGPSDEAWPPLTPPEIQSLEREVPSAETQDEAAEANQEPEAVTEVRNFFKRQLALRKEPKDWVRPAIGALASVVLILAIVFWPRASKTWEVTDTQLQLLQNYVQESLDEMDLVADPIVLIQRGQVVVSGHVKTDKDRALVRDTLQHISPNVATIIWSEEGLVRACEDILAILNLPLNVHARGLGVVQIEGYYPDPSAWERARQHLLTDIPGLDDIEDAVITANQVGELSLLMLKKNDLQDVVTVSAAPNALVAQGIIDSHMIKRWELVKTDLDELFGAFVPLVDWVTVSSVSDVERIYFDSEIASINLAGDNRWLILKNGKTYFQGSHLSSGYIIEEISTEGVALRKGDETITLGVGHNNNFTEIEE